MQYNRLARFCLTGSLVSSLAVHAAFGAGEAGFEVPITVSGGGFLTHQTEASPRMGGTFTAGSRLVAYPTLKLGSHWFVSGVIQANTRPYFYEHFATQGYGARADILQAQVGYSQFWNGGSVLVRAGMLSQAFGSFPLRYDDAVNPVIDLPVSYGYYYKYANMLGYAGAQVDVTQGKFDARAQLLNSSPGNRRSIFDHDQYANWVGGAGYTIRQGFRVGASAYRGPYLHRQHQFFYPGEAAPVQLKGSGAGVDVQYARGALSVNAEVQRFSRPYVAIPSFNCWAGYGEVKYTLGPRWYVAARSSYRRASLYIPDLDVHEVALAFRPAANQLIKVGYQRNVGPAVRGHLGDVLAVQWVATFTPVSTTF
ncbi:MAG: hypothetical protein U0Q16_39715 [Bryobacteraceae bacterium]